ncbi:MAG: pilus assembly protein PilM [Leptospiraceae bacterium]|nr:pilus assembly protein PilM [Leptospiraceae bacterium]
MAWFAENYLVIDYGSSYIKGALYEGGAGASKILRLESLPIVSIGSADPVALALVREARAEDDAADVPGPQESLQHVELGEYEYNLVRYVLSFFPEEQNFIINLPQEKLYVRDLNIPVINPRQLPEMIPFEVENLIPITLEEAEVQGIIAESNEESTRVVSFSVNRQVLIDTVEPLQRGDSAIRMLSVDAVGLAEFARLLPENDYRDRVIAQIDMGGEYTIFNALKNGQLIFTRKLDLGGADITRLVAEQFKLGNDEAEQRKLELGLDLTFLNKELQPDDAWFKRLRVEKSEYVKLLKKVESLFKELCEEIERSVLSLPVESPQVFYCSGGLSLMAGVIDYLGQELGRRVTAYPVALSNGENPALWATAIGTSAHYQRKSQDRLDFLNSPFGSTLKGGELNFNMFSTPIMILLLSVILFLGGLLAGVVLDRRQIQANRTELIKVARTIPGVKASSNYKTILNNIKQVCRTRLRSAGGTEDGQGILQILQEITRLTPGPDDLFFKLRLLTYTGDGVKFDADVNNYEDSTRLIAALKKSTLFSKVELAKNQRAYNQKLIRITVQIKLNRQSKLAGASCN